MNRSCELTAGCASSLTVHSVWLTLISLSWPILCSGAAEVLDTSVNVLWVGRELGDVSLAALSNANLLWGLLFVAAFGVSTAGTVRIGRSLGEGDVQGAKTTVRTMLIASIAMSLVCVPPMMIWARSLLECLGTPAAARAQAAEYLRILLLAMPAIYLNTAVLATLQAAGDTKTGLYLAVGGVAIDATLNPLLIMGVPPFPALGIAGSAAATLISQAIRLVVLLLHVYRIGHPLRLLKADLCTASIDLRPALSLLGDGGPVAVQLLWVLVEDMLMISLVNRFGADVTAAYGAVVQLWSLMLMPAVAVAAATTAMVAQNIGARRPDRVRSVSRLGLLCVMLATAMLVTLVEMFGTQFCGLFLPAGSPSLEFAAEINLEATWALVPIGGYMVWVGVLRGAGALWAPLAISAGVLAVRFPVTAGLLGRWHEHAIWWSFPASAAATAVLAAFHAHLGKPMQRMFSQRAGMRVPEGG